MLAKPFQSGLYKGHLNTTATLFHVHNKEVKELRQQMEKSYKAGGRVTMQYWRRDRGGRNCVRGRVIQLTSAAMLFLREGVRVHGWLGWVDNEVAQSEAEALRGASKTECLGPWPREGFLLSLQVEQACRGTPLLTPLWHVSLAQRGSGQSLVLFIAWTFPMWRHHFTSRKRWQ